MARKNKNISSKPMLADSKNCDIIESKMPELTPALIKKLKKIGRDIKKAEDKLPWYAFRYGG